jgi:hypothetical protein
MGGHGQRVGSRRQVWNGTAMETSGGLKRGDLFQDKYGNLKSRKASKKAKRSKNLKKAGYTAVKGKFGAVRISGKSVKSRKVSKKKRSSKKSKKSKKKKGGHGHTNTPRKRKSGGKTPRRRKVKQMGGVSASYTADASGTMLPLVAIPGNDEIINPDQTLDPKEWSYPVADTNSGLAVTTARGVSPGTTNDASSRSGAYTLTVGDAATGTAQEHVYRADAIQTVDAASNVDVRTGTGVDTDGNPQYVSGEMRVRGLTALSGPGIEYVRADSGTGSSGTGDSGTGDSGTEEDPAGDALGTGDAR